MGQPLEHNNELRCVDFSANGRLVATGGADNRARVWLVPEGDPRGRPLVHDGAVLWVDFSSNSRRILTCSEDGTARVWDTLEGAPASQKLQHGGAVTYGQFTPDGRRVLTVSKDGLGPDVARWSWRFRRICADRVYPVYSSHRRGAADGSECFGAY